MPGATDVSIEKYDVPKLVEAGDTLAYTIRFQNNGPGSVDVLTITDVLPPEAVPGSFSFSNASSAGALVVVSPTLTLEGPAAIGSASQAGSTITWVGQYPTPLVSGAVGYLTYTVQVIDPLPLGAVLTNTVVITTPEDTDPTNNQDDEQTPSPGIVLEKATNGFDADVGTGTEHCGR